jgi:putative nucleotidyltransferase with HDIG domain
MGRPHLTSIEPDQSVAAAPRRRGRIALPAALRPRWRGDLPPAAYAYIALVFGSWVALAAYTALSLTRHELLQLVPIIVATVLVQRLQLPLYGAELHVSVAVVGSLAAGMLFGPPGAVVVSTVKVVADAKVRARARTLLFNLGLLSLSNAGAAAVFTAWAGAAPVDEPIMLLPGALAAGGLVYLCESLGVTLIVALAQHRSPRRVWVEHFRWLLPHWMGLGVLALGLALTYDAAGIAGVIAFVGPALLMRYAIKQYVDHTARSVAELRERNAALEQANREIAAVTAQLRETYAGTLEALVSALDARDRETYGHSTRVARLTMILARQMGVVEGSPQWIDMERGALLHDVGKIGVSDAILRKPGKLTDEEWVQMRQHAGIGFAMLKDIPFLAGAAEIVAAHHERWDGKGYPRGLAGTAIPLGARIFMLADSFDAMATDRPYRRALSYEECLAEIERCAGTQFDPTVVAALRVVFPQWVALHRESLAEARRRASLAVVA